MTTVEITGTDLVVRLTGWDQLWALKRRISVPLGSVEHVGLAAPGITPNGVRAPGSYVPGGHLIAGTYRSRRGKEFWSVRNRSRAIVIALDGAPYTRLVLQVPDPEATVAAIEAARSRTSPS